MRAGHATEFFRPPDPGEAHEVADRGFISAPGRLAAGEPLDFGRHVGELLEPGIGQPPVGGLGRGRKRGGHLIILLLIICYQLSHRLSVTAGKCRDGQADHLGQDSHARWELDPPRASPTRKWMLVRQHRAHSAVEATDRATRYIRAVPQLFEFIQIAGDRDRRVGGHHPVELQLPIPIDLLANASMRRQMPLGRTLAS